MGVSGVLASLAALIVEKAVPPANDAKRCKSADADARRKNPEGVTRGDGVSRSGVNAALLKPRTETETVARSPFLLNRTAWA